MPNGMTLLESVAKSMAKPTTYRKASRVGMGPSRGAVRGQLEGVMDRRRNRVDQLNDVLDTKSQELVAGGVEDFGSNMDQEYDDYIEGQLEALREELEYNRPSSWTDYAFENGLDSEGEISSYFEPESFAIEAPSNYIDPNDLEQSEKFTNRMFGLPSRLMPRRQAQRRTDNYNRWQRDLANRSYNQQLGHDIARWNAALKGYNGGDIGAAMQALLNQGYSRDQVLQMLRGLPQ